ncbi:MAG TPA: aldo/keto reductase [Thermomicrobiales bacterium]|nr:aldo/keto reductase [Thermomicrobiales bacterium]
MSTPDPLAKRPFGTTGIQVPPISIGCAPLGNMPDTFAYSVSEDDALETIRTALDSPINYIDTAAAYGDGESERRIGIVLRERSGLPADAVLETKVGASPDGAYDGDSTRRRLERSLELLGMDRVEIVFLHDPEAIGFEAAMAPGGPVEVLESYRDQGVVGHLGVAGGPIDLMIRFVETDRFEAVITHNRYTLLNRIADPLLTLGHEKGIAVLNAAPYGSGILAKGPEAYPRYAYQQAEGTMVERAHQLAEICARHGIPLAAASLQFSMRDPRITSTIVGMSKPQRIPDTVDLARHPIGDDVWQELAEVPFDMTEPQ